MGICSTPFGLLLSSFFFFLFLAVQNSSIRDPGFRSLAHSLTQSLTDYITELPTFDCPVFTAQYAWEANGGVRGGVGVGNPICVKYQNPLFQSNFNLSFILQVLMYYPECHRHMCIKNSRSAFYTWIKIDKAQNKVWFLTFGLASILFTQRH